MEIFKYFTQTGSGYSIKFLTNKSMVDLSFSQFLSKNPISANFQAHPIIGIHSTAFLMNSLEF
jgi:hypothetical protein